MSESRIVKWKKGEFAEGMEWELESNTKVGYDNNPCPHCLPNPNFGKGDYAPTRDTNRFIIPWSINCLNEAGYNGTTLCLGCLVDAARSDLECYNYLTADEFSQTFKP